MTFKKLKKPIFLLSLLFLFTVFAEPILAASSTFFERASHEYKEICTKPDVGWQWVMTCYVFDKVHELEARLNITDNNVATISAKIIELEQNLSGLEQKFNLLPKFGTIVVAPIATVPGKIDLLINQPLEGGQHFIINAGDLSSQYSLVIFKSTVNNLNNPECSPRIHLTSVGAWNQTFVLPLNRDFEDNIGNGVNFDFFGVCSSETPIVNAWLEVVP